MASVDALLKIVVEEKKTFGIKLVEGEVPCLLTVEGERKLSMPPLNSALFRTFLEEIVEKEELDGLKESDSLHTQHVVPGVSVFKVKLTKGVKALSAVFSQDTNKASPRDVVTTRHGQDELFQREITSEGRHSGPPMERPFDSSSLQSGAQTEETPGSDFAGVSSTAIGDTASNESVDQKKKNGADDNLEKNDGRIMSTSREHFSSHSESKRIQVEGWVRHAIEMDATDLILAQNEPPRMRKNGRLSDITDEPVTTDGIFGFLAPALTSKHRLLLEQNGSVDLALELESISGAPFLRLRINLFEHINGFTAAIRPIARKTPDLGSLGLPQNLTQLALHPHGLVLFTGPTGSGKSTTLAALLGYLNRTLSRYVITIEDPIEYRYIQGRCVFHQREVGRHVPSFALGLKAALRGSPDVILVGEMRDRETIGAALTAAETGHLVLSTLHCGTSDMAMDRIIDTFDEFRHAQIRLQLADVLRAVVSQRLLPEKSGTGLVPAVELLVITPAVSALIREGRTHQIKSYLQSGREAGMISMEESLRRLVAEGRITRQTAFEHAPNPAILDI